VLAAADIAAVLLHLADADERTLIDRVKAVASIVQRRDIALLLDGRPEIVGRADADGAHLTGIEALTAALPALKPDRIAGVGGLATRHDAMTAGELGADYVLFGEPDENGQRPSTQAICDRLQWWDEVFELPSVGFAGTLEEVGAFTAAGSDFILAGDFIWSASEGPLKSLHAALEAIRKAHGAIPANAEAPQG
jgi:thiamine-phosphate pyrophosphorylase